MRPAPQDLDGTTPSVRPVVLTRRRMCTVAGWMALATASRQRETHVPMTAAPHLPALKERERSRVRPEREATQQGEAPQRHPPRLPTYRTNSHMAGVVARPVSATSPSTSTLAKPRANAAARIAPCGRGSRPTHRAGTAPAPAFPPPSGTPAPSRPAIQRANAAPTQRAANGVRAAVEAAALSVCDDGGKGGAISVGEGEGERGAPGPQSAERGHRHRHVRAAPRAGPPDRRGRDRRTCRGGPSRT